MDNFIDESRGLCPVAAILSGLVTSIKRKSRKKSFLISKINFATL